MAKIGDAERGDPVRVVRAISAVVNSVNDDGVLMGRWDGKGPLTYDVHQKNLTPTTLFFHKTTKP